jgi:hypothetical protein
VDTQKPATKIFLFLLPPSFMQYSGATARLSFCRRLRSTHSLMSKRSGTGMYVLIFTLPFGPASPDCFTRDAKKHTTLPHQAWIIRKLSNLMKQKDQATVLNP